MKNRNYKQNRKPQKNTRPEYDVIPFAAAEITVPAEEDFVTIPVADYTGLVANNALLEAVKRVIARDPYSYYTSLRILLGVKKEKEEE